MALTRAGHLDQARKAALVVDDPEADAGDVMTAFARGVLHALLASVPDQVVGELHAELRQRGESGLTPHHRPVL